jgi:hypothetical protein
LKCQHKTPPNHQPESEEEFNPGKAMRMMAEFELQMKENPVETKRIYDMWIESEKNQKK